ncbi:MAG: tellurite resistance/C4-dicarboxylate transporter family protein [Flavobacteriales bacterium]|nr:tellurite resistance/C4-dicarboxylate transporter family protein [Flavobacteriales bacterium]MBP9078647.1 tellurite resistance/C4-dicarboxylate transporter family protein [Flavobacteriales bacterium]
MKQRLFHAVRDLSPAYFAMVMATGVVSSAAHFMGMDTIAYPLFTANIFFYLVLCVLTLIRVFVFPRRMALDLFDHLRGMGFFTAPTATAVLGAQFILLEDAFRTAMGLWIVAVLLWTLVTYTVFTNLTIKGEKPSFSEGINGAWLLSVVSTQSLAVLSAKLSVHYVDHKLILNFFSLAMWLWGGMLYIWMISLIFYRYTFFKFNPGDLTPPYWINMGAMAISTLAGSLLILNTPHAPFLLSTLPFLKGFTIFYWVTGTWWVPMLFILAIWRHAYKRFPLTYDPLYWGAVFPLGMYTAATFEMAEAMDLQFLLPIPKLFIYVALAAWAATFYGFLRSLVRKVVMGTLPDTPGDPR